MRRLGGTALTTVRNQVRTVVSDDSGQDLLEYALLVALIALVAMAAVAASGTEVNAIFSRIATQLGAVS